MLKNKPMSTLSLALLLVLTIDSFTTTTTTATRTDGWPFWAHTTVQINNWLVSKAKLQVHCKDKSHDPGVHQLSYLESFKFKFLLSFIPKVHFYCDFAWNGESRSFYIYNEIRDWYTCQKFCDWIVLESGPCLHNPENGIYNRCYPWNPKSMVDLPGASYPLSELLVNQTNQP